MTLRRKKGRAGKPIGVFLSDGLQSRGRPFDHQDRSDQPLDKLPLLDHLIRINVQTGAPVYTLTEPIESEIILGFIPDVADVGQYIPHKLNRSATRQHLTLSCVEHPSWQLIYEHVLGN